MTIKLSSILVASALFMFSCAQDSSESKDSESPQETVEIEKSATEEIIDTVPVTVVFLKILGKENMIRGAYKEGQTEEEFIQSSSSNPEFQKLVNVDVKGSPFAADYEEEGFKDSEKGALSSKMSVYNMLYTSDEEVDQPFRISVITKVKDYRTWKWLYDIEEKNRINAGMIQLELGVNKDDPNEVFMLIAIDDIGKAREMMDHPGLEAKMEQSGVIGKPIVKFWRLAGPQSSEQ